MRLEIGIPLLVKNVKVVGRKGSVNVDLILDTGAAFTAISWSVLKAIGYDPAAVTERQEIITANGIIEVPLLRVDSIIIGNKKAREVEVISHDIPELAGLRG